MDKPHLRPFGAGGGTGGSGISGGEYSQIGGSDSDDSRSSISRSDDNENEGLPCIIYTSDDSADVGQSDSTCIDSEGMGYIAHNVQIQDDEGSHRLLLDSECPSPQPSPQPDTCFAVSHPLAAVTFSTGLDSDIGMVDDLDLQKDPECHGFVGSPHLGVHSEGRTYERSASVSSASSGSSPEAQQPLLPEYHTLPDFEDYAGVEYEPLHDHTISRGKMPLLGRLMVGSDVHIDAKYKDAPYVNWNWGRIRQTCVLLNMSVLLSLLCVGVGLLIQMPQGSECDPAHAWWQGSVMYEIYVPSFQDSNADGVGDLPGLISKLEYIQNLGIKAVRLNSIMEASDYLNNLTSITNYTAVDPLLGDSNDVKLLAALLHQKGMYLLMDMPLNSLQVTVPVMGNIANEEGVGNAKSIHSVSLAEVYPVLQYWLSLGVDGFFFTDITQFTSEPGLVEAMHEWRNILDRFSKGMEHKVMMVPVALLNNLKSMEFPHLDHLLQLVDLIDVPVNLTGSAETIPEVLKSATAWDSHVSLPWINWNMGGVKRERVATLTRHHPLGRALLLLFFPGTITLYYGDELGGLSQTSQARSWSTVMRWNGGKHAGFSSVKPWHDLSVGWENDNIEVQNNTISTLATMISARQEKVPIYINGIFDYEGDYHPSKAANYRVRHSDHELIIIDRFYPRRNQYAVVANLGHNTIDQDLSHFYFGGSVLASSHGQSGYVMFRNISLQPGEALACILDL
ncbi:oligo-1,6-glucosidase isoform X2 [Procambarus clarkii]|uniref:oligo-1,6-glucosidase isoform X2 n=1 Tax=Procambarus clarkii TaxID=6728 RepID=UPI001E677883|nr:neutral and basic amino acid transport protein rBAT-like [Procambarus clarkii]XP_045597411.1 neutral and basic amino acid transport protein rBAT-like [Procambarus clarkii]XP_045597412.1 neutral and basic amino acid transport protein rBAT-like [Procambarus clarkii]